MCQLLPLHFPKASALSSVAHPNRSRRILPASRISRWTKSSFPIRPHPQWTKLSSAWKKYKPPCAANVHPSEDIITTYSWIFLLKSLFELHSYPAVETNDLAIQHRVLDDMFCQGCIFRRPSQALGEWHLLAERDASGFWQTCQ